MHLLPLLHTLVIVIVILLILVFITLRLGLLLTMLALTLQSSQQSLVCFNTLPFAASPSLTNLTPSVLNSIRPLWLNSKRTRVNSGEGMVTRVVVGVVDVEGV
jgi:hypothetical protein